MLLTFNCYNWSTKNNPVVKSIFTPIIEKHHVDIVFNGHDHGISRTYPINNDKYYTDYSKGTLQAGYNATISNNKAYIDPSLIAKYYSGTYDADSLTLTINKVKYTFAKTDIFNDNSSLVNLDSIYKSGINCSYNDALNCILVDITGKVDTTGFTGFTIGQPAVPTVTPAAASTSNNTNSQSKNVLPNTGTVINTPVLVIIGLIVLAIGFVIVRNKKISFKKLLK